MLLSGAVLRRDILIMIGVLIVAWFVKVGVHHSLLPADLQLLAGLYRHPE